jgi:hypothetical protein
MVYVDTAGKVSLTQRDSIYGLIFHFGCGSQFLLSVNNIKWTAAVAARRRDTQSREAGCHLPNESSHLAECQNLCTVLDSGRNDESVPTSPKRSYSQFEAKSGKNLSRLIWNSLDFKKLTLGRLSYCGISSSSPLVVLACYEYTVR